MLCTAKQRVSQIWTKISQTNSITKWAPTLPWAHFTGLMSGFCLIPEILKMFEFVLARACTTRELCFTLDLKKTNEDFIRCLWAIFIPFVPAFLLSKETLRLIWHMRRPCQQSKPQRYHRRCLMLTHWQLFACFQPNQYQISFWWCIVNLHHTFLLLFSVSTTDSSEHVNDQLLEVARLR